MLMKRLKNMKVPGYCAGCGKVTMTYDAGAEWYVCGERYGCTSEEISESILEHVMYPNGRNDEDYQSVNEYYRSK